MTNEKRALISGAASGIGRATAFRLSREGWSLLLTDRNAEGLEETRRLTPGGALTIAGDYSSEETARRLYSFFACKGARDLRCCARRWQVRMDEERAFGRLCRAGCLLCGFPSPENPRRIALSALSFGNLQRDVAGRHYFLTRQGEKGSQDSKQP